jgi:hypothetical protein
MKEDMVSGSAEKEKEKHHPAISGHLVYPIAADT